MIKNVKYRGKRIEDGEWVYGSLTLFESGQAFISNQKVKPSDSYAFTYEVISETVGMLLDIKAQDGGDIFQGDLICSDAEVDGEMSTSYLPIVYENAAFWLDESFSKDGSYLTLLVEWDEPLKVGGNIHDNPELL
ncbi:MAG TPA: YopX family protein [Salinimicrobium sp.]|nr:YopX family protein [Salinimicrobium sp.]